MSRAITVADVRATCATLPAPGWEKLFEVDEARPAALLIPVVDDNGEAAVVFTKRSATMPSHRDDWVFPGGRLHPADASHAGAARRETAEELGVDASVIDIVGQLNTRGPIITGYLIETFVAILSTTNFSPDRREVADVATVRLSTLLSSGFRAPIPHGHDPGPQANGLTLRPAPLADLRHYTVRDNEHLWGMQADILCEFLHHLTDGQHTC